MGSHSNISQGHTWSNDWWCPVRLGGEGFFSPVMLSDVLYISSITSCVSHMLASSVPHCSVVGKCSRTCTYAPEEIQSRWQLVHWFNVRTFMSMKQWKKIKFARRPERWYFCVHSEVLTPVLSLSRQLFWKKSIARSLWHNDLCRLRKQSLQQEPVVINPCAWYVAGNYRKCQH